ncbi:DUF5067 domain-containing protein [Ignavigranum ruoffiae]|uniref:DUF5067 domain-containing protein n=1 Tax=Ignavigranum ruoffiae TaxID=89093 RepID=UPI002056D31B|nr:DUF5067 domain-containing protein [Ignavigranum ruoffiae]UPQ86337.1 DUF5067 domain-containing protein [Ignavigranum ruoffiae]
MNKLLVALFSFLILTNYTMVSAQQNDAQDTIENLESQIEEKEKELQALKKQLKELKIENSDQKIVLDQPIELGNFEITVTDFIISKNLAGDDALIINFHFVNNSKEAVMPLMAFEVKGFQNNVETAEPYIAEGINYEPGQKEIRSGGEVDAQTAIGLNNLEDPIEIELSPSIFYSNLKAKEKETYRLLLELDQLKVYE